MRRTVTLALSCVLAGAACSAPRPTPQGASPAPPATAAAPTAEAPTGGSPIIGPTPGVTSVPPGAASPAPPNIGPSPDPTIAPGAFIPGRVRLVLETVVAFGLSRPVFLTHAGDGSHLLYVVERGGLIKILLPNGTIRDRPFLDLRDRVASGGERGLYAVAFHPDFGSNGRLFVHWSNSANESVVEEYVAEGDGPVAPDTGRTLLRIGHPGQTNKGGWLGFGPDGFLYIAVGDGGGLPPGDPFRNARDTSKLLGKILRIDVDGAEPYVIPDDNPFAGSGGDVRPEIWAYGLRDPRRASFDRATGDLWIGDVGQERQEEVDAIPAGQGGLDFGWSDMEGTLCHRKRACDPADYVAPVSTYPTGSRGYCAVVGGYVYRGAGYPFMDGGYVYTDSCNSNIHGLHAADALASSEVARRGPRLATTGHTLVSFGEDEEGELYAVDLGGRIFRLIPVELQ